MDLKLKDVAELLNVSKTTIRRWLADGKIPAYRISNQYRFNRNEIEDWVMGHRVDSQTPSLTGRGKNSPTAKKALPHRVAEGESNLASFELFIMEGC